jgi:Double-GTPase 1
MAIVEAQKVQVVMLGLPDSGKTTFVAAFWEFVKSNSIKNTLKLHKYTGDQTYLNQISKFWLDAQTIPRTFIKNEGLGDFELFNPSAVNGQINLVVPDLSGERFSNQWEKRTISNEHYNHLKNATGVLFFIHPTKIKDSVINDSEIDTIDTVFEEENASSQTERIENPFDARGVPTQTVLVDLIQTTLLIEPSIKKFAIIISAWDLVMAMNLSPSKWLAGRMPFLSQFLETNESKFKYEIWGVSAQGGDLTDKSIETRKVLLGNKNPTERIVVVNGKKKHNDIMEPIKWLF